MAKTKKSFDYKDPFPVRFRELIEKKGATLDSLAAEFHTTRQTVSNWQNGATVPDAISICEIAKFFGVTTDYLLGLTDVKTVETDVRAVSEYTGLSEDALRTLQDHYLSNTIEWGKLRRDVLNQFLADTNLIKEILNYFVLFRRFSVSKVRFRILRIKYQEQSAQDDMDLYQFKIQNRINSFIENQRINAIKEAVPAIAEMIGCKNDIEDMNTGDAIEYLTERSLQEEKKRSDQFVRMWESAFPEVKSYSEYAEDLHLTGEDLDFYNALVASKSESGKQSDVEDE